MSVRRMLPALCDEVAEVADLRTAAERRGSAAFETASNQSTEQHYTPQEVAKLWGISGATVRRLFEDAPGVLKISMPHLLKNARTRKPRVSLRIPASALDRVHELQTRLLPDRKSKRGRTT